MKCETCAALRERCEKLEAAKLYARERAVEFLKRAEQAEDAWLWLLNPTATEGQDG